MADAFEPIREVFRAEGWKLGVDEGRKLGVDEGWKLGVDEGRRLGVDEGRKLGMEEKTMSIARNLVALHIPQGDIAKATGLAIDEVRALEEAHGAR